MLKEAANTISEISYIKRHGFIKGVLVIASHRKIYAYRQWESFLPFYRLLYFQGLSTRC